MEKEYSESRFAEIEKARTETQRIKVALND